MITLPLAVGIIMQLMMVLWVLSALFLIFIILIQKGKGGGLSSAFGGMGASSLLGTKTGDVLTWVTISCVGLFLILGIVLVKFYRPSAPTGLQQPAPVTAPATSPAAGESPSAPATDAPISVPVEAVPAAEQPAPAATDTPAAPAAPATAPSEQPEPAATPPAN